MSDVITVPDRVANLIAQVCAPDPARLKPGSSPKPIGVTQEIAQEAQNLTDAEIEALIYAHNLYGRALHDQQKRWAAEQLLSYMGPRVIPFVAKALRNEDIRHLQEPLISVLGKAGAPAVEVLDDILFSLQDIYVVMHTIGVLFQIGEPAAHLIALALERSEAEISAFIMGRISSLERRPDNVPISLVKPIADAIIEELVVRKPNRPNHFNDRVTAACLQTAIDRSPQLRRPIQTRLSDLAFQDDADIRGRAVQVAANLDLDDFLQLVRMKSPENPDVAEAIMYRLGRKEPLLTQKQSLEKYTGQLEALEQRSLARWDEMASQGKLSFRLRNLITVAYFLASLGIIGLGAWLLISSNDTAKQGIGGGISALTAVGGMLIRFWKAPIEDIQNSSTQQASVEATIIGFMTRTGQIRLLFEQQYAKGELSTEEMKPYQKMIADAQTQTAQELALIRGIRPETKKMGTSEPL